MSLSDNYTYRPEIIIAENEIGLGRLHSLLHTVKDHCIHDVFVDILKELIKLDNPSKVLSPEEINEELDSRLEGTGLYQGVWAYYPWNDRLVHLPEEKDFIKVRTSRNLYKITSEERDLLATKKVGIIGLSVGHSVAMNLALERSVGEFRLADFDEMELSNLNRIRSNLFNIGLPKVVVAAREIAEIDPFIEVKIYPKGITEENIDAFLKDEGGLDVIVEECDSLDIKILARKKAREIGIPVLMETSDRGMLDVERFDLEKDRPILHGLIDHLDQDKVKDLKSSEEKIPYLMPMVGLETMSHRLKASALEVGSTLTTWPQLGTSVLLGGAILSDTYRRIMLGQFSDSGRFIVDPAEVIRNSNSSVYINETKRERGILSKKDMSEMIASIEKDVESPVSIAEITEIVEAGGKAPSGGNAQPWKYYFKTGVLYLFLDRSSSESFMDYRYTASYMAVGASLENICVKAASLGYRINFELFPDTNNKDLIASMTFEILDKPENTELAEQLDKRYTDRRPSVSSDFPKEEIHVLKEISATFEDLESDFISDKENIEIIAEVVSMGDWLRVMNPSSHHDFISEEMRWSKEELEKLKDGIYVEELNLSPNDLAGLYLVKDQNVISFMNENEFGQGLKHISKRLIASSPLIFTCFSKNWDEISFVKGGMLMERLWLHCTQKNIGFQVINVPLAFLLRWKQKDLNSLEEGFVKEVDKMVDKMTSVCSDYKQMTDLFTVRLFSSNPMEPTSIRRGVEEILEFDE